MPEPTYSATTERLYGRLPEFMRNSDSRNNWVLKSWLSGMADQMGVVDTLLARIDYWSEPDGGEPGDTSDLTNPLTADKDWLPWLAQLVGVQLAPNLNETEMRDAIRFASSGWRAGTKKAVADAAKSELTGTKYAKVYDHSINSPGDGGEWDVLIVTRGTETPSGAAVVEAVKRKGAKPAGVFLRHRAYTASWAQSFRDTAVSTPGKYASWGSLEADNGTWVKIEEAGI